MDQALAGKRASNAERQAGHAAVRRLGGHVFCSGVLRPAFRRCGPADHCEVGEPPPSGYRSCWATLLARRRTAAWRGEDVPRSAHAEASGVGAVSSAVQSPAGRGAAGAGDILGPVVVEQSGLDRHRGEQRTRHGLPTGSRSGRRCGRAKLTSPPSGQCRPAEHLGETKEGGPLGRGRTMGKSPAHFAQWAQGRCPRYPAGWPNPGRCCCVDVEALIEAGRAAAPPAVPGPVAVSPAGPGASGSTNLSRRRHPRLAPDGGMTLRRQLLGSRQFVMVGGLPAGLTEQVGRARPAVAGVGVVTDRVQGNTGLSADRRRRPLRELRLELGDTGIQLIAGHRRFSIRRGS